MQEQELRPHSVEEQNPAESSCLSEKNLSYNGNKQAEDNDSTSRNKSIQTGMPFPPYTSKVADKISWYLEAVRQGEFQHIAHGQISRNGALRHTSSQVSLSSSLRSSKIVKGDLIDWHKNYFKSPNRPFSPRVLATNPSKSKVRQMRCYNPPRRKRTVSNSINSSDTFESSNDNTTEEGDEAEEEDDEDDDDEAIPEETNIDESGLAAGSLDHHKWLSEQALRAEIRKKFHGTHHAPSALLTQKSKIQYLQNTQNSTSNPLCNFNRDQEEKYLKFLCDVTEDILRSGVYTDRAIKRTFEFHLQFHSKDGDQDKLKQLFDQVLDGLQISSEEQDDIFERKNPSTTTAFSLQRESASFSNTPPEKESDFMPTTLERLKTSGIDDSNILTRGIGNLNLIGNTIDANSPSDMEANTTIDTVLSHTNMPNEES